MTAEEFKAIRTGAGMTQDQVADYLGLSRNSFHISRIENGKARVTRTVAKLMDRLGHETQEGTTPCL